MPLQHYTGDALLQIGLIVKVRIAKTIFTPDSGKFLSAKVSRYTVGKFLEKTLQTELLCKH